MAWAVTAMKRSLNIPTADSGPTTKLTWQILIQGLSFVSKQEVLRLAHTECG